MRKSIALASALLSIGVLAATATPAHAVYVEYVPGARVYAERPYSITIDDRRGIAFIVTADGVLRIDTSTGVPLGETVTPNGMAVAVNPVSDRVFLARPYHNDIVVLEGSTGDQVGAPIRASGGPAGLAVNAGVNRLFAANQLSGTVSVLDATTGARVSAPVTVGAGPTGIAISAAANRVFVTNQDDSSVSMLDATTGAVIGGAIDVLPFPYAVAVSEATNRVFVTHRFGNRVTVLDATTGAPVGYPGFAGKNPMYLAVDTTTNRVYVSSVDGATITVLDATTGTIIRAGYTLPSGETGVVGIDSARGRMIVGEPRSDRVRILVRGTSPLVSTPDERPIGYVGKPFSMKVTVTGFPAPTLSMNEKIPGLVFDPDTGIVSGTPTVAGTYPMVFQASNGMDPVGDESVIVILTVRP